MTATNLTANSSLVASSSLSSVVKLIIEMNTGEAESRNSNFATVGAGSEDLVNTIGLFLGNPTVAVLPLLALRHPCGAQ